MSCQEVSALAAIFFLTHFANGVVAVSLSFAAVCKCLDIKFLATNCGSLKIN